MDGAPSQIIGEAARKLSDAAKVRFATVPWRSIIGMRHVLVHQYVEIGIDLIWQVVEQHLPIMKAAIENEL